MKEKIQKREGYYTLDMPLRHSSEDAEWTIAHRRCKSGVVTFIG